MTWMMPLLDVISRSVMLAPAMLSLLPSFLMEAVRQFPNGGGLPCSVHSHDHDYSRRSIDASHGSIIGLEFFHQVLTDKILQLARVVHHLAVNAETNLLQNFRGCPNTDIRGDERVLQLIQKIRVDLLLAADRIFCCVPGALKKTAVHRTLRDPISGQVPATALRTHPNWSLYLDRDSAGELSAEAR